MDELSLAKKAKIDLTTRDNLDANQKFQLTETGFHFIDDHKGFRNGYTHGLLAYPGVGKTSIIRAVLKRTIKNHRVLFYSSEETKEQIEMKLLSNNFDVDDVEKNLFIIHERDVVGDNVNVEAWAKALEVACMDSKPEILIYDNITTSAVYQDFRNTLKITAAFQKIATDFNIPILIVYHTDGKFRENSGMEISPNDVRGSKDAVNKMEYLYGMQRHSFLNETGSKWIVMTVKILKCRMHHTSGDVYKLNWDYNDHEYKNDERLDYQEYKKFLKKGAGKK